jgi:crossover junction endodeoxyribonuclease RusA
VLPIPPSVNNLFINVRRGRIMAPRYKEWIATTDRMLMRRQIVRKSLKTRVRVWISVSRRCRSDLDNIAKPLLDRLVKWGIVEDDDKSVVQELRLTWSDAEDGVYVALYQA